MLLSVHTYLGELAPPLEKASTDQLPLGIKNIRLSLPARYVEFEVELWDLHMRFLLKAFSFIAVSVKPNLKVKNGIAWLDK